VNETTQFLVRHGPLLVFAAVFLDQIGVPLPSVPWLLAAGALSAAGKFSLLLWLGITVLACLIADLIWFYLGRHRGHRVLVCSAAFRWNRTPASGARKICIHATACAGSRGKIPARFEHRGSPACGDGGRQGQPLSPRRRVGALLYGGCFIFLGYIFSNQIQQIAAVLASIGWSALGLVVGLGTMYIGFKYWQRRRILNELRMARISVTELRRKQDTGEEVVIIDLRPGAEVSLDPYLIPGSVHLAVDEVEQRHHEIHETGR